MSKTSGIVTIAADHVTKAADSLAKALDDLERIWNHLQYDDPNNEIVYSAAEYVRRKFGRFDRMQKPPQKE